MRPRIVSALGMIALGMIGMGLFQGGGCVVKDLRFLHSARVGAEAKK